MNTNYEYKDQKLNYAIVTELIVQLFEGKGFQKVQVFREEVERHHLSNGGQKGVNLKYTVPDQLAKLVEDGLAEKHPQFRGAYQIPGNSEAVGNPAQVEEQRTSEALKALEARIDRLEALEALEARIDRLEKVVLLVLSSTIGNYASGSARDYLRIFQSFPVRKVELLQAEYGTSEKSIENFLNILEEEFGSR